MNETCPNCGKPWQLGEAQLYIARAANGQLQAENRRLREEIKSLKRPVVLPLSSTGTTNNIQFRWVGEGGEE